VNLFVSLFWFAIVVDLIISFSLNFTFKMNSQYIMALIVVFSSMVSSEQTVKKIAGRLENVGYYQLIYEFVANLSNFFSILKISSLIM
jgi:hypothetical protein